MSRQAEHLPPERLSSEILAEDEQAHVESCVRCRAQRRLSLAQRERKDFRSAIGPYERLSPIGQGGMARVYAATHRQTAVRRAIKLLSIGGSGARERFAREARLQQRVRHENVLPLLDILQLPDGIALVLPLVQGIHLGALLAERDLSEAEALSLFHAICSGVAAIHEARLVHRDLKPSNVLLDSAGDPLKVLVADFGIARLLDDLAPPMTEAGVLLGTPAYAAPEQHSDAGHVDQRADVFSLGVLLCEMLTGQRRVDPLPPEIPEGLRPLISAMTHRSPEQRPRDAGEVLARLPPCEPPGRALLASCRRAAPTDPQPIDVALPALAPLPAERDSFVGRDSELLDISERLSGDARLVTLTGPGGAGKTRLALRYASIWSGDFEGVTFCDLSEARDLEAIERITAEALGLQPGRAVEDALRARGRLLLVLDNLEQIADRCGALLGRWLDASRGLVILATSRQRLSIQGEEIVSVGPLARSEAVSLLRQRADSCARGWGPPGELPTLEAIVELLDGIPLAIELVAPRAAMMSPKALLSRLEGRLVSIGPSQGRTSRHRTLRETLDWSYALLTDSERDALAQLSVFEGGFSLEAVEEIVETSDPLADLGGLVDKSLVRPVGEDRAAMLGAVREYAAERLGAKTARLVERHGAYYARRGSEEELGAHRGPGGAERRQLLALDLENLRAASLRAVARGDGATAAGAALALNALIGLCASPAEVEGLLSASLSLPGVPEVRVCCALVWLLDLLGRPKEAQQRGEQALQLAHERGDRRGAALAREMLGLLCYFHERGAEAKAHFEEARAIASECNDLLQVAAIDSRLAILVADGGETKRALSMLRGARSSQRALGDELGELQTSNTLAAMLGEAGQTREACDVLESALALSARHRTPLRSRSTLLANLGSALLELGQLREARLHLREAIAIDREVNARRNEGLGVGNLARLDLLEGRVEEARDGFHRALLLHREQGFLPPQGAWLCGLAEIAALDGDPSREALIDEAVALSSPFPPIAAHVRAARAVMRARGGDRAGARDDIEAACVLGPDVVEVEAAKILVEAYEGKGDLSFERVEASMAQREVLASSRAGQRLEEARRVAATGGPHARRTPADP